MTTPTVTCPHCHASFQCPEEILGEYIYCTNCWKKFNTDPSTSFEGGQPGPSQDADPALAPSGPPPREAASPAPSSGPDAGEIPPLPPPTPAARETHPLVPSGIGLLATIAFYLVLVLPLGDTYFGALFGNRGWVPYVITFLTFWSAGILVLKYLGFHHQKEAFDTYLLPDASGAKIGVADVPRYIKRLSHLRENLSKTLLLQRVIRGLRHFHARRDTGEVGEFLTTQSDLDAARVESGYALLKVFIWAIPILGFIGTVIGIGDAVGGFSGAIQEAKELELIKGALGDVTTGLGVAFDTTLLALAMSLLIVFPTSYLEREEEAILARIDEYCGERLIPLLDDGARGPAANMGEEARQLIAGEFAAHRKALEDWSHRLGHIGEIITGQVVSGWKQVHGKLQEQYLENAAGMKEMGDGLRETTDSLSQIAPSLTEKMDASLQNVVAAWEGNLRRTDEIGRGLETNLNTFRTTVTETSGRYAEQAADSLKQLQTASEDMARDIGAALNAQKGLVGQFTHQMEILKSQTAEYAGDEQARAETMIQEFSRSLMISSEQLTQAHRSTLEKIGTEQTHQIGSTAKEVTRELGIVLGGYRRQIEALDKLLAGHRDMITRSDAFVDTMRNADERIARLDKTLHALNDTLIQRKTSWFPFNRRGL